MQKSETYQKSLDSGIVQLCHLHARDLSPHPWPPKEGEVVVLYTSPQDKTRGYVGILVASKGGVGEVQLLDSTDTVLHVPVEQLISTGKTGLDLCTQYIPTALNLSQAVEIERTLPDFSVVRTKQSSTKPKKPKSVQEALKTLNKDQITQLAALVLRKLKETKDANG